MDRIKTVKLFKALTTDTTRVVLVYLTARLRWFSLPDEQGHIISAGISAVSGVVFRPFLGKTPGWVAEVSGEAAQAEVANLVNSVIVGLSEE